MNILFRHFLTKKNLKIRFVLVGFVNTFVGLGIFPALFFGLDFLEFHYLTILTLSQIISVTWAFITNKYLVFRTKGNLEREYGKFVVFHAGIYILNLIALPFFVEVMSFHVVWSQFCFAFIVIVTSYFWHSRITFVTHDKGEKSSRII